MSKEKNQIIYDVESLPDFGLKEEARVQTMLRVKDKLGVVFYSSVGGKEPKAVSKNCDLKFLDTKLMSKDELDEYLRKTNEK